jgi:hypothetical protein
VEDMLGLTMSKIWSLTLGRICRELIMVPTWGKPWASDAACSTHSIFGPGNTGAVGATAAVPGPSLGTSRPRLVAAYAGLVGFARRRRRSFA